MQETRIILFTVLWTRCPGSCENVCENRADIVVENAAEHARLTLLPTHVYAQISTNSTMKLKCFSGAMKFLIASPFDVPIFSNAHVLSTRPCIEALYRNEAVVVTLM